MMSQSDAKKNREMFPEVGKIVDEFRAVFGDVKLKWASENGNEIGKRLDGDYISASDMVIEPKGKKK
jgi:hypothetical protein